MKFTVVKDLRSDKIMQPILLSVLFFSILYLISDLFVKDAGFGISVESIKSTLFGNEDEFLDPIAKNVFLEFWHTEIFFIMFISFILSTIYIRIAKGSKTSIVIVNLLLISSILSLISLPMAYFLSEIFIYPYVVSFLIWHLLAILSAFISMRVLSYAKSV